MEEVLTKVIVSFIWIILFGGLSSLMAKGFEFTKKELIVTTAIQSIIVMAIVFFGITYAKYRVILGESSTYYTNKVIYLEDGSIHFTPYGENKCVTIKDEFKVSQIKD